jgi:hypothetical protein
MLPTEDSGSSGVEDHGRASAARAGGLAVGLAMLESPARHGLKSKYVDVRPGQAGRLLPKTAGFVAVLEGNCNPAGDDSAVSGECRVPLLPGPERAQES